MAYGFYAGTTGVVVQPYTGYTSDDPRGLATGVLKGMEGLILKPSAGIVNLIRVLHDSAMWAMLIFR